MRRRYSGRVHPWPGAERGWAGWVSADSSALLAGCRADWLEMASLVSLLKMACSTFMVIALTSAFWRPTVKECVRRKKRPGFLLSLCVWGHRSVCSVERALTQADPVFVILCLQVRRVLVIICNEAVV